MDGDGPANGLDALPNSNQAQPSRSLPRQDFVEVETRSIVTDGTLHFRLVVTEPDFHPACPSVVGNVGRGLLDEAIKGSLDPGRQTLRHRVGQVYGKAAAFGNPVDQTLEGWNEPQIVEHRRPEIVRDFS